jgi:hypothetical protein
MLLALQKHVGDLGVESPRMLLQSQKHATRRPVTSQLNSKLHRGNKPLEDSMPRVLQP